MGSLEKEVREGSAPLAWRQLHVPPWGLAPSLLHISSPWFTDYVIAILAEPLGLLLTGFIVRIPFIYLVIKRWKDSQT